jgi:hypothetical protein
MSCVYDSHSVATPKRYTVHAKGFTHAAEDCVVRRNSSCVWSDIQREKPTLSSVRHIIRRALLERAARRGRFVTVCGPSMHRFSGPLRANLLLPFRCLGGVRA